MFTKPWNRRGKYKITMVSISMYWVWLTFKLRRVQGFKLHPEMLFFTSLSWKFLYECDWLTNSYWRHNHVPCLWQLKSNIANTCVIYTSETSTSRQSCGCCIFFAIPSSFSPLRYHDQLFTCKLTLVLSTWTRVNTDLYLHYTEPSHI